TNFENAQILISLIPVFFSECVIQWGNAHNFTHSEPSFMYTSKVSNSKKESPLFPLGFSSSEYATLLPVSSVSNGSSKRSTIRCCVCLISSCSRFLYCTSATHP